MSMLLLLEGKPRLDADSAVDGFVLQKDRKISISAEIQVSAAVFSGKCYQPYIRTIIWQSKDSSVAVL